MVLEHIFQQAEKDVLTDAAKTTGGLWEVSKEQSGNNAQVAAMEASKAYKLPYAHQVADWAVQGRNDGFNDASTNVRRMADDLETEILAAG
ncbi:hypothetical protein ACGF5F_30415 [Streptomyces sp. NPDC047821]|uniref:hypothetical protein n=1 Tax=Streptomyces sp. NPDC047821 TaxID=3365488 RepID=UPI0037230CE9